MEGIPRARDTDVEDVVWALQTAEALWKRSERGDAIVWLRRAAQAAGEANDDDRAFALASEAAELTEWMARSSSTQAYSVSPSSEPGSSGGVEIDSLLRTSQVDPTARASRPVPPAFPPPPFLDPPLLDGATIVPSVDDAPDTEPPLREEPAAASIRSPTSIRVLSAAESHAGMLDPWSEGEEKRKVENARAEALPGFRSSSDVPGPMAKEEDEVVTSLPPIAIPAVARTVTSVTAARSWVSTPSPPKPPAPPTLPKTPPAPPRPEPQTLISDMPTRKSKLPSRVAEATRARVSPPQLPFATEAPAPLSPATEPDMVRAALAPILQAATVEESPLDLSALDAFADLPDDARDAFARAANLCHYAKGEAVEPFALAFVVQGDVDVSASEVPFVATRIGAGRVLRARGTLDEPIPLRLVCASNALVATWDRDAMEGGLGPCPWVEDDLRTSGDRVQALVGSTLGALGPRLSVELRTSIVERLVIRVFAEHEAIVTEGVSVPGLLLVAAGAVDLVSDYAPPTRVGAGQFVLAAEALSAGASPATVRAAHGGALVLMGDRKTTQELFATEPLLLEIFAGW